MPAVLEHAIRLITPPTTDIVTIAEVKRHCNVTATDEDDYLVALLRAATELVERETNRAFLSQTWQLTRTCFPASSRVELPRSPLQSVSSITYYDADGNSQTFASSNYHVDTVREPGVVWLDEDSDWPDTDDRPDAVTVNYVAGWSDVEDVPARAVQAVLLLVGHWYRQREAVGIAGFEVPFAYRALVDSLRVGNYL